VTSYMYMFTSTGLVRLDAAWSH